MKIRTGLLSSLYAGISDEAKGKGVQLAMQCRCGREAILAHGMCATCYTLRRQNDENFGGLRETVLKRDGYRCRVCDTPGTGKRGIIVHHRIPGRSELKLMVSLCPACHSRVHRTKAVLAAMPPSLLVLWREQNPKCHEQKQLDFREVVNLTLEAVPCFRLMCVEKPAVWKLSSGELVEAANLFL